jgi:hypothetical protein
MEIIKRRMEVNRNILSGEMQIGYNSDGRLTIRFFNVDNLNEDTLIILDFYETKSLISFLNKLNINK